MWRSYILKILLSQQHNVFTTAIIISIVLSRSPDHATLIKTLSFLSLLASHLCHHAGSWLTLHNCDIFYLLAVNYDPATTDLIFIRVNIYPGPGQGAHSWFFNPFISITPSKPLMSSGSWLTLHNCEIFYILAVNYDPATTDLIFIRVNIYPGPGEGGSQPISYPIHFIRVTIYPAALPHNISRGHYWPRGVGGGGLQADFPNDLFHQGHYLPRDIVPQY